MKVSEAMAAYSDGTLEKKVRDSAERRKAIPEVKETKSSIQAGRDLYASMHPTKKEQ